MRLMRDFRLVDRWRGLGSGPNTTGLSRRNLDDLLLLSRGRGDRIVHLLDRNLQRRFALRRGCSFGDGNRHGWQGLEL
jgi:hypothetical protein